MGWITNPSEDRVPLVTASEIMADAQPWRAVAKSREKRLTWVSPVGEREK